MAKDIVILLDGTSNEIGRKRTNVLRLYGCLKSDEAQLVYYDPGVGTLEAQNAWSRLRRRTAEIWGMATGSGMDRNVKEAYRFLCANYEHGEGGEDADRIWLMGFSRGAYTARVLAGFLHAFGVLRPEQMNLLDYAYRAYKGIGEGAGAREDADAEAAFAEIRLHDRALRPQKVAVAGLALMDTVASVIEWGRRGIRLKHHAYTANNPSVRFLRHAVAIDERRSMYRAALWGPDREVRKPFAKPGSGEPQDAKEVWFAGVHGDVGGGYEEARSQLGKIPLAWLIEETRAAGLRYKTRSVNRLVLGTTEGDKYVAPDPTADQNVSLTWGWWPLELWPSPDRAAPGRRFLGLTWPLGAYRHIPEGATIHPSVATRLQARPDYRPPNLAGHLPPPADEDDRDTNAERAE